MYVHWVGWLMTTIVMSQPLPGRSSVSRSSAPTVHPLTARIVFIGCPDPRVSAFLVPALALDLHHAPPGPGVPLPVTGRGGGRREGGAVSLVSLSTLPVSPAAGPGTVTGGAVGHPTGSGSGIVGQLPVWSARGAGVKTASPAERGPSLARRLDGGEHGRMMCCPTMPSVTTPPAIAGRGGLWTDASVRPVNGTAINQGSGHRPAVPSG